MIAKLSVFLALTDASAQPAVQTPAVKLAVQPAVEPKATAVTEARETPVLRNGAVPKPDVVTPTPDAAVDQKKNAAVTPTPDAAVDQKPEDVAKGGEPKPDEKKTITVGPPEPDAKAAAPKKQTCPVNTEKDAEKYPCVYSFADNKVHLYIGSDAGNVHMKATTKDRRWVAVGPSNAGMNNLHAVINDGEPSTSENAGERLIEGKKQPEAWTKPTKTAFQKEPTLTMGGGLRSIELVFDAGKWDADFKSGVSIAWGADESKDSVAYHEPTNRKFINFNGDDDQYKLPVAGTTTTVTAPVNATTTVTPPIDATTTVTAPVNGTTNVTEADAEAKNNAVSFCAYSALLLLPLCF